MKRVVKGFVKFGKSINKKIKRGPGIIARETLTEQINHLIDTDIEIESENEDLLMVSTMIQLNGFLPVNSFSIMN